MGLRQSYFLPPASVRRMGKGNVFSLLGTPSPRYNTSTGPLQGYPSVWFHVPSWGGTPGKDLGTPPPDKLCLGRFRCERYTSYSFPREDCLVLFLLVASPLKSDATYLVTTVYVVLYLWMYVCL